MGNQIETTGCGCSTTDSVGIYGTAVKVPLQSGKNLHYNGPNLPGTGVQTCDTLNEALQKMDAIILTLREEVLALQQTINQM